MAEINPRLEKAPVENMDISVISEEKDTSEMPQSKEESKDAGPKFLDLAFAMDCTGSMGSYIASATQNVRQIVEEIVAQEKADIRLALVEYRDHPPQDRSFVTKVHDFTSSVRTMKQWLEQCSAQGGGDCPEAVADALQQVYKLDWRPNSTKVCVFIADAPPHGLGSCGDGFPDGCPDGIDPMEVTGRLSQKCISLYVVGCEPSISPYKNFFMALAHLTGGQYVPLGSAKLLAKVITGGVQEEISLQQLMADVNQEVMEEFQADETAEVREEEITRRVHMNLQAKGARVRTLQMNCANLPEASVQAQQLSSCTNMADVRKIQGTTEPQQQQQRLRSRHAPPGGPPSASPGFFSRIFNFGRSGTKSMSPPPPPPMMEDESYEIPSAEPLQPQRRAARGLPLAAPECTMSMGSASASDTYGTVEDDISEAQVQRMVQKAVYSNNLETRYKKKH